MEKKSVGRWDARYWDDRDPVAPTSHFHALSSFPLAFFFGMAFRATPRVTSLGAVWAPGFHMATKRVQWGEC